jgi:hypothetical protein
MLIADINTGLPVLSASGTPQYFCPNCQTAFWQGKQDKPEEKRKGKQGE